MNIERNIFNLRNEIAIVTGGSGHLGYAIAEGLSQFGAEVAIAGRNERICADAAEKITAVTGNLCVGINLDISSRESIARGFKRVANEMGDINILINNSSYSAQNSLEMMTNEEWAKGIDGTATGVMMCTQEILKYLSNSHCRNKSIINIASMYGMVSPNPAIYGNSGYDNPPNYGAGKAAVIQLTKYAACHLAKYGVRVNSVSPGPFPKPKVQENDWFINQLNSRTPLNRIGQPQELKGATIFLASSASSYVTGHNLVVDGGWTAW